MGLLHARAPRTKQTPEEMKEALGREDIAVQFVIHGVESVLPELVATVNAAAPAGRSASN